MDGKTYMVNRCNICDSDKFFVLLGSKDNSILCIQCSNKPNSEYFVCTRCDMLLPKKVRVTDSMRYCRDCFNEYTARMQRNRYAKLHKSYSGYCSSKHHDDCNGMFKKHSKQKCKCPCHEGEKVQTCHDYINYDWCCMCTRAYPKDKYAKCPLHNVQLRKAARHSRKRDAKRID